MTTNRQTMLGYSPLSRLENILGWNHILLGSPWTRAATRSPCYLETSKIPREALSFWPPHQQAMPSTAQPRRAPSAAMTAGAPTEEGVHFHRSGNGAFLACGTPVGHVAPGRFSPHYSEDAQRVTCPVCLDVIEGHREWAPPPDAVVARDPKPGDCYAQRWCHTESEKQHVRVRMLGMGEDKPLVGVTWRRTWTDSIMTLVAFDDEFVRCPAEKHDHQR